MARYLGVALGGSLKQEMSEAEARELWDAHDPAMREGDFETEFVLWAFSETYVFKFAPVRFRRLDEDPAS